MGISVCFMCCDRGKRSTWNIAEFIVGLKSIRTISLNKEALHERPYRNLAFTSLFIVEQPGELEIHH